MLTRIIALVLPVFFVASARSATPSLPDIYREQLAGAAARLQQTDADLYNAQAALNDAAARQIYYDGGLTAILTQAEASRQAIANAQREIDRALPELQRRTESVQQKRAAFDSAKATADASAGEVEQYRQSAIARLESSEPFQRQTAELQSAERSLADARQMFDHWLRTTADYAELYDELEESEEIVRAMRQMESPDRDALTEASNRWLSALNALETFRAEANASDDSAKIAAARVDALERTRQAMVDQFNRELAADASYKRLVDAAGAAQSVASAAANDLNTADGDRAALTGDLDNLRALIANSETRLAQAAQDAAAYQAALASVGFEVQQYDAAYVQLCTVVYVAQNDCDAQVRRCRESVQRARAGHWQGRWTGNHDREPRDHADRERHEREEREARDNERRQAELVQRNRGERDRILAEAEARRRQEDDLRRSSDAHSARERERVAAETEQREKEKQRSQEKRDREAHQRDTADRAQVASDPSAREAESRRQSEPRRESADSDRRADAQRQVEARERADRERPQQQDQQARADQERRATETRQRETESRQRQQDQEREQARNRANESRRADESRRAEETRRAEESRRAEQSKQAEASRRADDARRAEESRRNDEARRSDEARRTEESRRNEESRRRDDDSNSRRQSDQRDRDRDNNFRKR